MSKRRKQGRTYGGFQTPEGIKLNREDHVWFADGEGSFKCCLCGAVAEVPPSYPTPPYWTPKRYEVLSNEERALCPPGDSSGR